MITCSRCKAKVKSNFDFNMHSCKGLREIKNMPDDLLLKLIHREITESDAWKIADSRLENK